jgi:hypothetical protein
MQKNKMPSLVPTLDGLNTYLQTLKSMGASDIKRLCKDQNIVATITGFLEHECARDSDKQVPFHKYG